MHKHNSWGRIGIMKQSSAIVCPICGGPTHLSRDTGDFTCDRCGKIVVRANVNHWIPDMFGDPIIVEAMHDASKDIEQFLKELESRGWIRENRSKNSVKMTWPHYKLENDTREPGKRRGYFFIHTGGNKRTLENKRSEANYLETNHPKPEEERVEQPQQTDAGLEAAAEIAKQKGLAAEQRIKQQAEENRPAVIDRGPSKKVQQEEPVVSPGPSLVTDTIRTPKTQNDVAVQNDHNYWYGPRYTQMSLGELPATVENVSSDIADNPPEAEEGPKELAPTYTDSCAKTSGTVKHRKNGESVTNCKYCTTFNYYTGMLKKLNSSDNIPTTYNLRANTKAMVDAVLSEKPESADHPEAHARAIQAKTNYEDALAARQNAVNPTVASRYYYSDRG